MDTSFQVTKKIQNARGYCDLFQANDPNAAYEEATKKNLLTKQNSKLNPFPYPINVKNSRPTKFVSQPHR